MDEVSELSALVVASAGGHLDELLLVGADLGVDLDAAHWVTSRTAQTESLLAGCDVHWTPRIGPGQSGAALLSVPHAVSLLRRLRPDEVVSTGAAQSVPFLLAAVLCHIPARYVESATRTRGPSATGRLARLLPGVVVFAQGDGWGDPAWGVVPSVFDQFRAVVHEQAPASVTRRVVVTLGSERFPFTRAAEQLPRLLDGHDVRWQTGNTTVMEHGQEVQRWVPASTLREWLASADVVVTHAGVGSVLATLNAGKVPVVLPRRSRFGEHIDDHQVDVAELLTGKDLAVCVDPEDALERHLQEAAGRAVRRAAWTPPVG